MKNEKRITIIILEESSGRRGWSNLSDEEVLKIWAEAKVRWQSGEPLYLTGAVEEESRMKQEAHREISAREGLIEAFVEKKVPADWARWPIDRRRDFWCGATRTAEGSEIELVERDRISAIEVWCELFNGSIKDVKNSDTRKINAVLKRLSGWRRADTIIRFGPYSSQRGFIRK